MTRRTVTALTVGLVAGWVAGDRAAVLRLHRRLVELRRNGRVEELLDHAWDHEPAVVAARDQLQAAYAAVTDRVVRDLLGGKDQ